MNILFQLAGNVILGFVAHLSKEYTTGHMKNGWQHISNYTLGTIYVFPLILIMNGTLKNDIKGQELRYIVSHLLSYLTFGIGVVVGYWYKPDQD